MLKVLLIIIAALVVILAVLYFLGKKAEKKQADAQAQIDAAAQEVSMLIIDKRKMKLKDANLPAIVMENAPRMSKMVKMPIVKAKVGPKVTTMLCDEKVFDQLPVKKECKVVISGLYITKVKSVRGGQVEKAPAKKKGLKGLFSKNK